jgi:hypothetical protein
MIDFRSVRLSREGVIDRLSGVDTAYVGWLSFDDRTDVVAKALNGEFTAVAVYFTFKEYREQNRGARRRVKSLTSADKLRFEEVERTDQSLGFHHFRSVVKNMSLETSQIYIDVSAFPREYVCMCARIICESERPHVFKLIYNHAEDYSFKESPEKKWLSSGAGAAQPVATFSGSVVPGRETVLIVLSGFDGDRTEQIADSIDPNELLLGVPENPDMNMTWFIDRIDRYCRQVKWKHKSVSTFSFDCNSIESTYQILNEICAPFFTNNYNVIVAPYNNKMSTFAAALFSIELQRPQVVFAPAIIYNFDSFALPSNRFTVVEDFRDRARL